jgi:hypothetical protein
LFNADLGRIDKGCHYYPLKVLNCQNGWDENNTAPSQGEGEDSGL